MGLLGSYLSGKSDGSVFGGLAAKAGAKRSTSMQSAEPDSYKRGGTVRKTGMAKVHKGERVLTKRQAKRFRSK